jgi:hypothetical protein
MATWSPDPATDHGVSLQFIPDVRVLTELRQRFGGTKSTSANEHFARKVRSYPFDHEPEFGMPVRLRAGGVDLFTTRLPQPLLQSETIPPEYFEEMTPRGIVPWLALPIMQFAFNATWTLSTTAPEKTSVVESGDQSILQFTRVGIEHLWITAPPCGTAAEVPYSAAVLAFSAFSESVKRFLLDHLPELAVHPRYGTWLQS